MNIHSGEITVSWSAADIPGQHGRTAVVTGANGGLGLETARQLAAKGAHVVMAVRNQKKAAAAVDEIRASAPDAALELVGLDLASQASVRAAAEQIMAAHKNIDLLINNAGVMGIPEAKTADGFEMQFGVDHLGHWALTGLLLPALLRTHGARIVTVTSTAHHMGRAVDPANPHLHGRYRPWRAYGQAKLANFHFGLGLQRELEKAGAGTASLIAHPGLSNTDLQAVSVQQTGGGTSQRFFELLARRTGMSAADGALSQLRAATDLAAKGGEFYGPLFVNSGPPVRKPIMRTLGMDNAIAALWEVSERETGIAIDVRAAAAA
jgi:NAD(P)-dependent dehydrogenase (short-subunit alcohol dehydrogenase family)